jgi:hypothetical protein
MYRCLLIDLSMWWIYTLIGVQAMFARADESKLAALRKAQQDGAALPCGGKSLGGVLVRRLHLCEPEAWKGDAMHLRSSGKAFLLALLVGAGVVALSVESVGQSAVPANATARQAGGWTCNDGYLQRAQACVTVADATDAEIRQALFRRSSGGSCTCPDDRDRAGRRCGARSAYSRPGGASPMCYPSDVSAAAVKQYRAKYSTDRK